MAKKRYFGWVPDLPDSRDRRFSLVSPVELPKVVSLRSKCGPVVDQGQIGSCVGNATASACYFDQLKQKAKTPAYGSRLFIYYNARVKLGTVNSDSGCMIRDAVKSIVTLGVPPETLWPYDTPAFKTKPPVVAYREALNHQALVYSRIEGITACKQCIASGYPFVFGFSVYESFMSSAVARTGRVPLPSPLKERLLGGHAVMAVGYDDKLECFIVANSWGSGWGDKGYFYLPYEYVKDPDLSNDFWTITRTE